MTLSAVSLFGLLILNTQYMFVHTGRYHREYIKWGQYTSREDILSRLCKTCGFPWGDHNGDYCPGIDYAHIPHCKPEFGVLLNQNTQVI
jgi:hypothetical protein